MKLSFDEIRYYYELMQKQSTKQLNEYEAQVTRGLNDSLQLWQQPTVKDKIIEDKDGRNRPKQPSQILEMSHSRKKI